MRALILFLCLSSSAFADDKITDGEALSLQAAQARLEAARAQYALALVSVYRAHSLADEDEVNVATRVITRRKPKAAK